MKPEISVVIPLYNKERYIRRTIDSVLRQTFQNFECIIIDSSTDGSTDIVRNYTDPRIRHIIQENRTFLPLARNIGVRSAQSDLIAFIDADDEWAPDHLESLITLSSLFPHAGLYATPYVKLRPDGSPVTMIFADIPRPPWQGYIQEYFRTCARGDVPICSSSCALRKGIFNETGGFDESLIHGGEDQHLWGRIALQHPVAFTWKGPAIYHTEALGRMCNDSRPFIGDPLSTHLEEHLAQGSIPSDIIPDVKAYIRRRQKTVWVSQLLCRTELKRDGTSGETLSKNSVWKEMAAPIALLFSHCVRIFLGSRFYDACRRMWCYLHGWHIARLE